MRALLPLSLILLASCTAPMATGPRTGGDAETAGPTSCPDGAKLVTLPSGRTSCAHTTAEIVRTGTASTLDDETVEALAAEANRRGKSIAYTDGNYTVTVHPKP